MTVQIDWQLDPLTGGAFHSFAPRSIRQGQVLSYSGKADDPDAVFTALTPVQVTEQMALDTVPFPTGAGFPTYERNQPGLVNQTLFLWKDTTTNFALDWLICPWLIASSKRIERDRGNKTLFRCAVEYNSGSRQSLDESELYLIPVPIDIAAYPFVKENLWDEEDRIIYQEADAGQSGLPLRLPTGNLYSEPFRRRQPTRAIRQHQFEVIDAGSINSIIEGRLFTTNDIAFEGDPAPATDPNGGEPPRWMITAIDYQSVQAVSENTPKDDPPLLIADAYIMTYTIQRTSRDGGWYDRRALIDTHFLREPYDLTTKDVFRNPTDGSTIIPGLIAADGTRLPDQTGDPNFLNYVTQPKGSWSFLRQ